ncbi:50S ribosomal protein L19e [Candidatus Woesearchaeota archaeon]|nr:50S ribosomal protein L19e [Candidatus Woesearchaeota archaeon]
MELTVQRRLAAEVLHCSPKRVWFDETRLGDIKEAITKQDLRGLIAKGLIQMKRKRGISRGRARFNQAQRRKGRQRGHGSRKGLATARQPEKRAWLARIRLQRVFIKSLRDKNMISNVAYRELYMKCKGGYFRSLRHVKLYLDEHNLITKKK